jgi:hypothetical protein
MSGTRNAAMESTETGQLERRLTDAIGELQKRIQAVEIWAAAVVGFAKPVPDEDIRVRGVAVLDA